MIECEYLVIGASYAGSLLAADLSGKGDTLLVDKSQPGELMNCGGCLPIETFKKLEVDIPYTTTSRILMNINGMERSFPAKYVVVDRRDLNRALFEKAIGAGAEFTRLSYIKHNPAEKTANFAYHGKETVIKYRKLIFTDGFHPAKVRISQKMKGKLPCGAAKVQIIEGQTPYPDTLYFKITKENPVGYSWIFPMPENRMNIGAGGFNSGKVPEAFIDNLKKSENLDGRVLIRGGGVLPVNPLSRVQENNTYLFGNAAGMVYALNGEGLKHISDISSQWADAIVNDNNLNRRWKFSKTFFKLKFASYTLKILLAGSKFFNKPLYPLACRAAAKSRNIIKT
jgi:flavin-dependent dehydrogenase